jgi:hypothetical protein
LKQLADERDNDETSDKTTVSTSQKLKEARQQLEILKQAVLGSADASMATAKTTVSTRNKLKAVQAQLKALRTAPPMQDNQDNNLSIATMKTTASTTQALADAQAQLDELQATTPTIPAKATNADEMQVNDPLIATHKTTASTHKALAAALASLALLQNYNASGILISPNKVPDNPRPTDTEPGGVGQEI